jgi:hypothetical protein
MEPERELRSEHELLAVFDDQAKIEATTRDLQRAGVEPESITVGAPRDHDVALGAEMRDELSNAWIGAQASFIMTKEGMRGFLLMLAVLVGSTAAIATPFAFIEFGGLPFWGRWLIIVGSVVAMTSVIALVGGPAIASRRSNAAMAAQRGTTLRVSNSRDETAEILEVHEPIRVDEVSADDLPVQPVATEEDDGSGSTLASEAAEAVDDLSTNIGTDDVHPDPEERDTP